jgi:cobalt-zinc-cadmium efflux system membrane fusion protein
MASVELRQQLSTLDVTGAVQPDVSREIPVLSLANGRVVALRVGLGDVVHKGQLVMEVQSADVAAAFGNYLKAVSDEHLSTSTLARDKLLYDKGAIALSQLEIAQNAQDDSEAARVASEQQLKILGVDRDHPSDTVKVYAPASGVVIAQNATAAGAAGISYAGPSGSLTIADLSHVWVVCDVYESDLSTVRLGEQATIHLSAFPGRTFSGIVSDIGALLDPSLRTAKVRIQVANPGGILRVGMFAQASLLGSHAENTLVVPSTAVLHLHDREYVFVPVNEPGSFKRVPVKAGRITGELTAITGGLASGQQVVRNALDLQNTVDQE